jgi:pimeloyl-ACP methyl ester carboxylesterase
VQVSARDGTRLHVLLQSPTELPQTESPSTGAPILWLQGLNAPASAWAVQMAHFARTHRQVAFDARGVGKSDAPPGPYTTRLLAEDALDVLDACGIARAHVVGLSLGGATAQELALRFPERVETLALLSTFPAESPRASALLRSWRALFPLAHQSPELRAAWERQAYAWLFTERFWRGESNLRAALRFAAAQPLQSIVGYQAQIDAALAHDARGRLGQIRAPTLVAHGALDQLASLEGAEELAKEIPGAVLLAIPDVGHAVNLEAQRQINTALRELWSRRPSTTRGDG